jgi:hypothetical protein
MPKNRPNTGDTGWGVTLNAHLSQLAPTGGGINFGTSDPILVAGDDGYTYVNTLQREIRRWNGIAWEILLGGLATGRETLTANRTYYVDNTAGNDANDGLTATTAFATIQRAFDVIKFKLDSQTFTVTVQLTASASPYAGATLTNWRGNMVINGQSLNASQYVIDTTVLVSAINQVRGLSFDNAGNIAITNIQFIGQSNPAAQQYCIYADNNSIVSMTANAFGTCSSTVESIHIGGFRGSDINIFGGYQINGSATVHYRFYLYARLGVNRIGLLNPVVALTGTIAFAVYAQFDSYCALARINNASFNYTGAATGQQYGITRWTYIDAGGNPNFFAGSTAGTTDATSIYG